MDEIIRHFKANGHHFFDDNAMKFFASKLYPQYVFMGPGGLFIVTSEQFINERDHTKLPRTYTPRKIIWSGVGAPTFGSIQWDGHDIAIDQHRTRLQAVSIARKLASQEPSCADKHDGHTTKR